MNGRPLVICTRLAIVVLTAMGGAATFEGSTLKPTHLKGLKGVNVVAYVSRDLPDFALLEEDVLAEARAALARDGDVVPQGPAGVWLSIHVETYPAEGKLRPGDMLLHVRVRLREQVTLVRDPSLEIPGGNGAITWSSEWIGIVSKTDLQKAVRKEVEWRVGSFAADVKYVNSTK